MKDPILEAADQVTPSGDAVFKGDCNDIYVVHTKPILEGKVYRTGGVSIMIRRRASKQEYLERCPQVPRMTNPDRYYFYLGVVVQPSSKTNLCHKLEGDVYYCPLTDTIMGEAEFGLYGCVDRCTFEQHNLSCDGLARPVKGEAE